ncbi:autophagy protein, partial [Ascosphaera acerosa]
GEVLIFDTVKLEAINVIAAHRSPLCCIALNGEGTLLATASDKGTIVRVFSVPDGQKLYQFRRGSMPARIYHMSFNVTSTLLCVSSASDTIHIFKLAPPPPPAPSSPEVAIASRKPNGTLMGMIRRTSQTVGSSLANTVGGYLPRGVTEMWEPARDFAWVRLPKSPGAAAAATAATTAASPSSASSPTSPAVGSGGAGAGAAASSRHVRSLVAMCPNTPQVMVVTSDGHLYIYDVDLSKGGEGRLTKQFCYID